MADYTGIFERVEQKYLLDSLQFEALWAVLEPYMRPDEYGRSTICNIYFDTPNYLLARLSGEKPVYKEKLRLRTYGVPKAESPSFVELKKKYQGIVYKRRIVMPYGEAYDWLVNGKVPKENSQIAKEIAWSLHYYGDLKSAMARATTVWHFTAAKTAACASHSIPTYALEKKIPTCVRGTTGDCC